MFWHCQEPETTSALFYLSPMDTGAQWLSNLYVVLVLWCCTMAFTKLITYPCLLVWIHVPVFPTRFKNCVHNAVDNLFGFFACNYQHVRLLWCCNVCTVMCCHPVMYRCNMMFTRKMSPVMCRSLNTSVVKSRWLCYFQESRSTCGKFYFLPSRSSV